MYQHLPSPVKFREDINGLRAWAVIGVLLFHFSLIGLPGGFVGVDVFFVISGYLMTAIIIGGYKKEGFSVWKFYMARVRRIVPALLLLIAALITLGWFFLPTADYQALGGQSAYAMAFLSNIYYFKTAGYFDVAAEEKWLLHTWTLAVEAQFYVLYPLILSVLWKVWRSMKAINIGVVIVFIISLLLNLIISEWKPTAAFYLLPTRGWELVAGGLVYLIATQKLIPSSFSKTFFWVGWTLIIASFVFINKHLVWPGYWAIFPVLGASLVVLAHRERSLFTNNVIAQWLGDRSYSLYLWHWPLVVALNFADVGTQWTWVITAFALSLLLAHISYEFIETPTRKYLTRSKLLKEVILLASVGMVIGLSAVSVKLLMFKDRISPQIEIAANEAINFDLRRNECLTSLGSTQMAKGCTYGHGEIGAIMIGDSHSGATVTAVAKAAELHNKAIFYRGMDGCTSIMGIKQTSDNPERNQAFQACQKFNRDGRELINAYPSDIPLIIVNRLNATFLGPNEGHFPESKKAEMLEKIDDKTTKLIQTLCEYQKHRQVYVIRPIPEIGIDVPKTLSRNMMFGRDNSDIYVTRKAVMERSQLAWKTEDQAVKQCGVKVLNPLPYLCDANVCHGSIAGRPLYIDDDHLSEYGNHFLIPMFEQVFLNTSSDRMHAQFSY